MSTSAYRSQAARDAKASGYGGESYWERLDRHALDLHAYFTARGDTETAESMLTRSLGESLVGNDGE